MLLHTSLFRSERPRRDSPSRHPRPTFTTMVHSIMATDNLPGDVSDDNWDNGHPALPMDWVPTVPRTFPQYTRPFEPWSDISRDNSGHLRRRWNAASVTPYFRISCNTTPENTVIIRGSGPGKSFPLMSRCSRTPLGDLRGRSQPERSRNAR
jgi:hypothetical protein